MCKYAQKDAWNNNEIRENLKKFLSFFSRKNLQNR